MDFFTDEPKSIYFTIIILSLHFIVWDSKISETDVSFENLHSCLWLSMFYNDNYKIGTVSVFKTV